tara:strand:- start:362 stop:538 length:177 start_codon:yes stop_codon:yes gene_type:complete
MKRFFKKGNGIIIEANDNHDIQSLEDRFTECDEDGKEIKKEVKKVAKKAKKESKKQDK